MYLSQGHKRAPSDVSVASSEDEKIPLSPSILESVPEKVEPILPVPPLPTVPEPNTVISTSFVEEPVAPTAGMPNEKTSNTPVEDESVEQTAEEKELRGAGEDVASPEPAKEMQQLKITAEDEKEADTAELPAHTQANVESSEVTETVAVEESNAQEEKEEDQYKHLKVTLTLPEQQNVVPKEENREKPTDKDHIMADNEKQVVDKAKDEKERDSDSGRGSATDNNSVDLNLSISSFLSKTKEPGSVSIQVTVQVFICQ